MFTINEERFRKALEKIIQEEKTFEREIWEKIAKKFHQKESKKATKKEPKHG